VGATVFEFGGFKLDCDRFELYREGRSLKLERKPMELLILLATRNGHLVTRTEIAERLWAREVFVDTEHGINTAIRKIRRVLRDDPDEPRFLQTVTGRGYRFVIAGNGQPKQAVATIPEEGMPDPPGPPQPIGEQPPPASVTGVSGREPDRIDTAAFKSAPMKAKLAFAILVLGLAAVLAFQFRNRILPARASQIHSIAVLPLANLSGDASQDYFADGMTEEVITMLAKNTSLRVVSRTSAMQYKGAKRPLREIARELGVDGILEGSVARSADRVHMTVQLIYAPTDTHVWAESYDRDLNQAFLLPSELSRNIAKEVKNATSPAAVPRYINPEAHDAYLRGRYLWFSFNVQQILPYFQKAIQLQPDYAAAWSGLADTYVLGGMLVFPPKDVIAKAEFAARKSVELDDSLPEAHNSMAAWYLFCGWDLPHADAESRRAIELNPNYAEGHYVRHYVLHMMNRPSEALQEEKRAVELEPFARNWGLAGLYIRLRQYDSAITELRIQSDLRPDESGLHHLLSEAYWLKGMYEESQQEFEKALELEHRPEAAAAAHRAFEQGGEKAVERWGANDIKARARKEYVPTWDIGFIVAFTGDKEETLKYLESAYQEHSLSIVGLQNEPIFAFLHSDPRYRELVKKIGLPPAY
jgi:TolB-like protein/DNA-binding winged helix-turn-helix (wHTH) protein/Flp pilus assembly protein TadD